MTMNLISFHISFVLFAFVNLVHSLSLPTNFVQVRQKLDKPIGIGRNVYEMHNKQPDLINTWFTHHKFVEHLRNIHETAKIKELTKAPTLLHSFKWNTCDNNASILHLSSVNVGPDPLHFPGSIYVQFDGTLKETVDAPLKLSMIVKKEITTSFWLQVPCVNGIGSCVYDDLCETLEGAQCPRPLVKYSVPCKCPFPKGPYKMLKSGFKINVEDVPGGNYYIKANASYGSRPVTCLEFYFSILQV